MMNYAGFWLRLTANLIDYLILLPFIVLQMSLSGISKELAIFLNILNFVFFYSMTILFLIKFGATPGKLIMKIKVLKINGDNIGIKEAILRDCIGIILGLLSIYCFVYAMSHVDFIQYQKEKWKALLNFYPQWYNTLNVVNQIWVCSEFIILLTNKKRRALHDFIAGTVVVDRRPKKQNSIADITYKDLEKNIKKIKV